MSNQFEFKIDAWTPATLPMERLGQYLLELAKLYGEQDSVHFEKLKKGSAVLVASVDGTALPKVERRLTEIDTGEAPKEVVSAFRAIDDMLANDNATGVLRLPRRPNNRARVLVFPGRTRPKPVEYGPIREEGCLEGEIVRIGGKDKSVHVTLQDGETTYTSIETNRETARELGPLIFGPIVRLWGTGTWRRNRESVWTLDRFVVSRFEEIAPGSLSASLAELRSVEGNKWHEVRDPVGTLIRERSDEQG